MRKAIPLSCALVLVWVGCGGGAPPATTPTTQPDNSASAEPGADAGPARSPIESKRAPFVQACLAKLNAPDYCNCAFDQFRDVFKDVDLSVDPAPAQLALVKERTASACGPKLTEDSIKEAFASTCLAGDTRKTAYCDCLYPALRKNLQLQDFLGDFEGARMQDSKKAAATACKGKLSEEVAKAEFVGGCTKAAPAQGKACECVWKTLRAKATAEEILGGAVDMKTAGLEVCKPK